MTDNEFWLGINDIEEEDKWVYSSTGTAITVTNWGPGDPNGNRTSNCVVTWIGSSYHSSWADAPCTEKYGAVCERLAEYEGQCPSGWLRNKDKCYFFTTEEYNWVEAEVRNSFWLGINDIILENNWVYTSDMSPITVKSWGPGDPNGFAGANCVATYHLSNYHSLWADEPCTQKHRCVCERETTYV
ncbi:hypothetical protein KUTeg_002788 [Tegillarca granosa]|uniref:C-type lectin domain-containing protein n=1 Tax=Tegillarca granosa TaxID=220873 RepID=A0ABQ9FTP8_TEGGR|nr:hypothetical protein KUTeg_002788 [Tegillarca granosa]